MTQPLQLRGCRHDILGHYLKAVGLLRVLAKCADKDHCDPDAEGWWDLESACFCLRSSKYDTQEKLTEFFAVHYRPTPVFAAWNKEPGCSSEDSEKLGVLSEWEVANKLSQQVVTVEDRKKPANYGKLVASEAFEAYREDSEPSVAEALDAIASPFLRSNSEHPLFLSKGIAGHAHIWRTHWKYLMVFQKHRDAYKKAAAKISENTGTASQFQRLKEKAEAALQPIADSLFGGVNADALSIKGKGTPFFPDAIKSYNIGSGWVTEDYPFNAMDYVLAVEGAFAMRGSMGRILAARARRFAAFPFVFDAGEEMVDDSAEVKGLCHSLWLPLWDMPVTFAELSSFVTDAQARLPGKEARFGAEFMRALYSQGVDAGFAGWQEFRFKMKASRVPWVTTGGYLDPRFREDATRLNHALQPLDESRFLDQFEIRWKGSKADPQSPHPVATTINDAMEAAIRETTPRRCLELLHTVFVACRKVTMSKTFREMLPGKRARFFQPLPMEDWNALFAGFDEPEFRIARAVASIVGQRNQADGKYSEVLPMLGSLLPLKLGKNGWYLPDECSYQAVWTGTEVCHDLAAVLARRYLDSLTDDQPALVSSFGAPLADVLSFLRGELDDHLIGRWIEALSLIGWRSTSVDEHPQEWQAHAIPIEYAALRVLLELECQPRQPGDTAKRRSQQPVILLCQRSSSTLPVAVSEALRWISIWGVPNPDPNLRSEKKRLAGRDILRISPHSFHPTVSVTRLAAAVCIGVHWSERDRLFREISVPKTDT